VCFVDPKNPDVVYTFHVTAYKSTDGGNSFTAFKGGPPGGDRSAGDVGSTHRRQAHPHGLRPGGDRLIRRRRTPGAHGTINPRSRCTTSHGQFISLLDLHDPAGRRRNRDAQSWQSGGHHEQDWKPGARLGMGHDPPIRRDPMSSTRAGSASRRSPIPAEMDSTWTGAGSVAQLRPSSDLPIVFATWHAGRAARGLINTSWQTADGGATWSS